MSKAYIEQAKREKEEEERRRAAAQKTKDWYDRNGPRYQRSVEESFARNRAYGEAQREKKRQLSSLAPTLGGQQKQLRRELSGSLVKAPNPLVTQFGIRRYDEHQKHEQEKGDYIQRVYDSAGMRESERVAGDDSPYLPKAYSNDERRRALSAKGRELDTDYQYLLDVQKTRAMRRAVPEDNPYRDLSPDEILERMEAYRREKRLLEEERVRLDADTARVQEEIKSEEYEKRYGYLLKEADFAQYGGYPSKRYPEMSEENSPSAALGAAYAEEYGLSPVSKEERRALSGGAVTENRDFYVGLSEEDRAMYRLISHEIGSDEATGYALMDEEERGIFRYLYNRDGADAAREYYENLSEELTKRQGQREKSAVEAIENPLVRKTQELAGAYGAGLSDFGTAVHQTFSRSDAVPLGAVQYQAEATAAEKTGFDRVLYDATRAVGGMTPALAAGAIAGAAGLPAGAAKWIGQSVMGLNAYGNSYRNALESGHGEGEATAYALLSAASEVATEKALSGISALGGSLPGALKAKLGQNMGSAALRFALNMGVSMGSEGFEEVLQNEIDLLLRNSILGEENDLNLFTEENLYTFLSSAFSAGVLELPGTAFQTQRVTPGADAGAAIDRSYDTIARTGLWSPTSTGSMAEAAGMARAQVAQYNENAANASTRRLAKAGDVSFRPLPVFKDGKVVEPDQPALPKGVRIVENETVESGSGTVHDIPKGAVGTLPNGVKAYTPEQAQQKNKVRDTYMSFVISGKQGLKDFWNRITGRDNKGAKKETAYLGLVTPEMGKVYEQVIGQDLTNYSYAISSDTIEHIQKKHGENANLRVIEETPITEESFSQILDSIQKPDEIYDAGKDNLGHQVILTVSRKDGTAVYVQWVQGNRKGMKVLNGKTFFTSEADLVPAWDTENHENITWIKRSDAKKEAHLTAMNGTVGTPPLNVQNVVSPASSNVNISQSNADVNVQYTQSEAEVSTSDTTGAFGDDSVGAARPLTTEEKAQRYDDYVREYGPIPKGENPVRDVDVPRKTGKNRHTRQGARTFIESAHTPEAMVQEFKAAIAEDLFAYERSGNKEMQNQADAVLHNEGFDGALEKWDAVYERGIAKPGELVLGETLYIEAARKGEKQLAIELAAEVSEMATEAGRSVQVMRIMSKATPEGTLYSLENSVRKINENLKSKYKKKFERGKMQEVSISNELKEKLLSAKTREEADAILSEIERHIAEQLPSTIGDRVDAWRYFAMLSNPRTHIRNFLGNVVFGRAVDAKDLVGAALEKAFLPQDERSKAVLTPKDKALRDFATEDFKTVRDEIMGTGKMNPQGRIEAQKKVFEHEVFNKITGAPGNLLEWADEKALRPRYAKALAGFLKARGITAETIHTEKGRKALAAGRQYAITEAKKATFRDTSRVANELSRWEKKNAFTRVLIGGTIPFKKTPVNVLKRGVEYSPVGLVKGTADLLTKVRDGKMSASQAIDELSAGTVGTGLAILGYWLGSMGIVSLGGSDDEKERGFESLQGKQNYALNIGGHSYTIDWLSPAAMPFFVGAEFQKLLEEGSGLAPKDMLEAVSKILDPVLEMSFMGGVQDILESAAYGELGGPLANIVVSPFVNYPSQFIPSVLGGVARQADPVRRSYYADKNNNVFTNSMQKSFQKAVAKIPYFSQTLEPYVDQWGREEVNDSVFGRLLENFASPGYYSEETVTAVDEEIERLYAQTGKKTVLPAYAPDDVTQAGNTYNMTAKEHTQYAKTKGQTAFNTINALLNTSDYRVADDTEKLDFIEDAYKYANQVAKKELLSGRGVAYKADKWVEEAYSKAGNQKGGTSVAKSIAFRRTLAEADLGVESYDKVRMAQRKMGISYQDYADVYADISAARKQYEGSDEKTDKIREAIYGNTELSADQKAYMSFLFVRGDVEDADALKTLGGISYSVYEDYLNEASKITSEDDNGDRIYGLAKRRKERYIDSLPINNSQKELLKATISKSNASKAYLKYRIEVAPLTREQKSELWEHFLGD